MSPGIRRRTGVGAGGHGLPECPACYAYPASPDLAASLEGKDIDTSRLVLAAEQAASKTDILLVEGAGGLMVPLTAGVTLLDLLQETRWAVLLVASARLGSINHTLLSLEALAGRQIPLAGLVFNEVPHVDACMREHALATFRRGLRRYDFPERLALLPDSGAANSEPDFSVLFG